MGRILSHVPCLTKPKAYLRARIQWLCQLREANREECFWKWSAAQEKIIQRNGSGCTPHLKRILHSKRNISLLLLDPDSSLAARRLYKCFAWLQYTMGLRMMVKA